MKYSITRLLFLTTFLLLFASTSGFACNLADLTLCGVYKTPLLDPAFSADTMICVTLCTGYGRTGTSKGAGNDTRSISFGWYSQKPGFVVRAFTPAEIVSGRGFSNCTMPGANVGPLGAPYNDQGTVIFIDPGYYGTQPCFTQPFGCITSTALCGNVAQQCITYRFQMSKVPDSLRVFGVEGGGNPLAGCYPDADMKIDPFIFSLAWGEVDGIVVGKSIRVKWATVSETNTDQFIIQRATASNSFEDIGSVVAAGNSTTLIRYDFYDLTPTPGANRYRIVEVDKSGTISISTAIEVVFEAPAGLSWGSVGPNPASDFANLTFYNEKSGPMTLSVYDLNGKAVVKQLINSEIGSNAIRLELESIDAGVYYVSLQGSEGKLTRKIVKL